MSTMRNAIQRRNRRERGQIEERQRWGLLEKPKDYSTRARDFNAKKSTLRALRRKVLEKHPDEFYFGMLSRSGPSTTGKNWTGTLDGDRGHKVMSHDTVRLLKTQDLAYIRTMRNKATKEVESLKKMVTGIDSQAGKIVYVDNEEEQAQKVEAYLSIAEVAEDIAETLETKRRRELKWRESKKIGIRLDVEQKRLKVLAEAEGALELQRAKTAKSPSAGGITKHGFKLKVRQRKR